MPVLSLLSSSWTALNSFYILEAILIFAGSWDSVEAEEIFVSDLEKVYECANCDVLAQDGAKDAKDGVFTGMDIFYTFFLASVIVLSVLGNGIIALVLYRKRQLSPSSRLVFSLCCSNFCLSLILLPFYLVSNILGEWIFGISWCWTSAFLLHFVTSVSNMTLAAIAIDRYYAIVKPMSYSVTVTTAKSLLILVGIWSFALLINLPPLFSWPSISYDQTVSMCLFQLDERPSYAWFLFILSVLIPISIMTSSYGCIFKVARSKYKKINIGTVSACVPQMLESVPTPLHGSPLRPNTLGPPAFGSLPHHYRRKPSWLSIVLQSPIKGFAVICCILGMFYLTWTPYVVTVLGIFNGSIDRSSWQWKLGHFIVLISIPSYPVIYGLLNRSIRKDLVVWLRTEKQRHASYSAQFRSASNSSPSIGNSTPIIGFLDYTPPFWQWRRQLNRTENIAQRKLSEDSGRFSLPPPEETEVNKMTENEVCLDEGTDRQKVNMEVLLEENFGEIGDSDNGIELEENYERV